MVVSTFLYSQPDHFLGKRTNLTDFGWGILGIREMGKVRKLDDKKKGIKIKSLDKADKAHWW